MMKIAGYIDGDGKPKVNRDALVKEILASDAYGKPSLIKIPVVGTIRAGEPIERLEEVEGYELVEPEMLRGREAFVLKVQGDSMIGDRIYEGDRVVCVVQQEVTTSDIAVVAINGDEATLKRVKCQNNICMLIPSNPNLEPMIYPSKDVYIIGKVIEVRHSLE